MKISTGQLRIAGSALIPQDNSGNKATADLGSATHEWRDLYLGNSSNIFMGNSQEVDLQYVSSSVGLGLLLHSASTDAGNAVSLFFDNYSGTPSASLGPIGGFGSGTRGIAMRATGSVRLEATHTFSISSISVTAGGSDYSSAPAVQINGSSDGSGLAKGATATATVSGGQVTGVTVTAAGGGFTGTPSITFDGGGGNSAQASATMSAEGSSSEIVLGKQSGDISTLKMLASQVSSSHGLFVGQSAFTGHVHLTGTYAYKSDTPGHLSGSSFSSRGAVSASFLAQAENLYAYAGAKNQRIASITVTNGGSGYTSAPSVLIGGSGNGQATAVLSGDSVASITVTNKGEYASTPSITLSGGGGSSAAATAVLEYKSKIFSDGDILATGSIAAEGKLSGSSFQIGDDLAISETGALSGATSIDGSGDLTMGTITMTGFSVDADGDVALKSLKVDDDSTIGCDSDADLLTLSDGALAVAGTLDVAGTLACDTSFTLDSVAINATELGYIDGVTAGTVAASKAVVVDASKNIATLGTVGCGAITSTGASSFGTISSVGNVSGSGDISLGAASSLKIASVALDATDLGKLDGITNGTAAANKAVVLDGSKNIGTLGTVACGAITSTGASTMGSLTLTGDLFVDGTTTTVDSTTIQVSSSFTFEGSSADDHETVLFATDPTADTQLNLPAMSAGTYYIPVLAASTTSAINATPAQLDYTIATPGTAAASKAVVLDASKNIATLGTVGCGAITSTGASSFGTISSVGNVSGSGDISLGAASSLKIASVDLDATDLGKLDGITNGTAAANKAVVLDGSKNIGTLGTVACGAITSTGASSMGSLDVGGTLACDTSFTLDSVAINATELGFIDGVTAGTAAASKALVLDGDKDIGTIRNLTIDGVFTDGNYTFDTSGNVSGLGTVGCGAITSTGASSMGSLDVGGTLACDTSFTLDSVAINATELGYIDGVTAGTAAASKAVVLDASKNIGTLGTVACGAITSTGASSMDSLDVSGAVSVAGTLSMAGDLVHTDDTNNKIAFGTDTQSFETGGTARINLSDLGLQIGSGARVTTTLDEDDMASDSATALATQQSIKAYVDSADRVVTDIFVKNEGSGRHDAGGIASTLTGSNTQYWKMTLSQLPVEPTSRTAAVGQGVSVFINGVLQRFDTGSLNLDLDDGNDNWYGHFRRGTGSDANKKIIMIKHTLLDDDIISIKYSKA